MEGKMEAKIIDNYIITNQKLGEGTFGTVYRGYLKDDKAKILAVKQIELKNLKGDYRLLKRELELLNLLESPNIVKFYKPMRTPNNLYFFLEYCQTDLKKYMKSKKEGYLSQAQAVSFLRNICEGFKVLQQNNVIHRDIKPANILIKNGVAKITDFGFARIVDNVDDKVAHTFLGSPLYMSPEILAKKEFSAKCDVWSLGMTFYQMLYGRTPWTAGNIPALLQNIRTRKLEFPAQPHRSQQVKQLLQSMLAVSEEQRISWNDIFLHDLITGIHSKKVQEKLNQIAGSELESLQKSFTLNQLYINNNRVLNQAHNIESLEESNISRQESEKEKVVSNNDHEADLKYQQMRQRQEEAVEKVDRYFRYRRNVLVYVNITTNLFFGQCKQLLPPSLFYMGVYSLQKYQVHGYHELINIFNSKMELERFAEVEWKLYKTSNYYWKTLKSFKTDNRYLLPYFKEVFNVSTRFFEKNVIEEDLMQVYKAFEEEHNEKLADFNPKVYEQVIDCILARLRKQGVSSSLIHSLEICRRPLENLTEQIDFYQLYEQEATEPVYKTQSVKQAVSVAN